MATVTDNRTGGAAVTDWQPVRSPASATVEILTRLSVNVVHCIPGCIVVDRFDRNPDSTKGAHLETRFHSVPEWTWPVVKRWALGWAA